MKTTSNKSMEPKQPGILAGVTRGKILVRCVLTVALVVAGLLMAACNSRILGTALQGKYVSGKHSTMNMEIEFKSGNKANFNYGILGERSPTTELDYEVHGKEVTFKNMMKSNMVAKIADDGCLDFGGSAFGKVCKQTDASLAPEGTSGNAPPPYIFNGAYATYRLIVGDVSIPFTMAISEVNLVRQTCKTSQTFEGSFSNHSNSSTGHFRFMALPPSMLEQMRSRAPGGKVRHNVAVSVPAGTFSTEELSWSKQQSWADAKSGLAIKVIGPTLPNSLGIKASGTIELIKTNVPTTLSE